MFFLLRMAFWLTVVLALLPTGSSQPSAKAGSQVDAGNAVAAAGAAVSDLSTFCDRQADACVVGAQTALAIGERAQAGAKMVYEFISERMAKSATGSLPEGKSADAKSPAAKTVSVPLPQPRPSQGTLKPADLAPAWRSPALRQEAQPQKDRKPAA